MLPVQHFAEQPPSTGNPVFIMTQDALKMNADPGPDSQSILDSIQEGIWTTDRDDRLTYFNPSMERITEMKAADVLGLKVTADFPQDSAGQFFEYYERAKSIRQPIPYEIEVVTPAGRHTVQAGWCTPRIRENTYDGMVCTIRDVTENRKAEDALRETTADYQALFANMHSGFAYHRVIFDKNDEPVDYVFLEINGAFQEHTGLGRDIIGKRVTEIHPGIERGEPDFIRIYGEVAKTGRPARLETFFEPQQHWYSISAYCPKRGFFVAVFDDITAQKQTLERVAESERRFRAVFDSNMVGVGFWGPQGQVFDANDAYLAIVGRTREDLANDRVNWRTQTPPEHHSSDDHAIEQIMKDGICTPYEKESLRLDGTRVPVVIGGALIQRSPLMGVAFALDITERKKAEKERQEFESQLNRTQRLESLGLLAGGIAHDFNNLLGGILGNIDLARSTLDDKAQAAKYLQTAIGAFTRAKDLTRQLLTFSKGGAPATQPVALGAVLEEARSLALSGSRLRCEIGLGDDLDTVDADPNQLAQVMNNVLLNARQAMPEGGRISVEAENSHIRSQGIAGLSEGHYALITVRDEGVGIPASVLPKVFDPFFTTRESGSGLGLATCHSIVRRHGGAMTLESTLGAGTTVRIYLPVSHTAAVSRSQEPASTQRLAGRVLVMDDEEVMRSVATHMLRHLGLEVVCVRDGEEAEATFARELKSGGRFDAVLLDLTIPGGMGGERAMAQIRKLDPEVPGVVASGYSDSPVLAEPAKYGFAGKIEKPYRTSQLRAVLGTVLRAT